VITLWEELGFEHLVEHARKFLRSEVIVEPQYFVVSASKVFGVSEEMVFKALRKAEDLEYELDRREVSAHV
jgi:hypothetical protein